MRTIILQILFLGLLSGSLFGQELSQAQTTSPRQLQQTESGENEGYLINFPNVSIIEYIRFISQITNKNFIYKESELQFNVTILSEEPTNVENILAALIQILRIHGLSLLEQGNNLIIHKNASISQVPRVISDPTGTPGLVTKVFQLRNVAPQTIFKIIRQMVSKDSVVDISEETRHLIVTDVARNLDQIEKLLKELDTPNLVLDIGTYKASNARLETLIELAQRILTPLAESNPLVMVPQHSSSSIFIVSTPYLIDRTLSVFNTLDVTATAEDVEEVLPPGHIESTNFYIHKLQYHRGNKIVGSLQNVGSALANSATTNEALVNSIRSAQWLEVTNSVLFTGDAASLRKVRELVENLDVPLRQVFIEMLVVDTSITKSLSFGVDWGASLRKGNLATAVGSLTNFPSTGSHQLPGAITATTPNADALATTEGFSLGIIGSSLSQGGSSFTSLGALVKALQKDQDTNILLNPKIITQDTSPAEIFVGGTSAFQSSQSVNDQGQIVTVNVDYREIGTRLLVTPILGPDNIITLEIEQEISEDRQGSSSSSAVGATNTVQLGPVTTKTTTKTRVSVPDQNFLIMSGMIRESTDKSNSKVPCLGSVPYLGSSLFAQKANATNKRNLMIFLRPHIVSTPEEAAALTRREQRIYEEQTPHGHMLYRNENMKPATPESLERTGEDPDFFKLPFELDLDNLNPF